MKKKNFSRREFLERIQVLCGLVRPITECLNTGCCPLHAAPAGPGRIPQKHEAIIHYCKKLKINLQPCIFACRSNLLQNDNFNQGRSTPLRWIKALGRPDFRHPAPDKANQ